MLDILRNRPIVPVIVIDDPDSAVPLAEALLAGGIDVVEITLRTAAGIEAMQRIANRFPDMVVGAGTVVTDAQAQRVIDAGVSFAVAPGLNQMTVERFRRAGIPFAPGVMTPSEIEQAMAMGCMVMKFFPAEAAGGTAFLGALSGPYGHLGIKLVPTGGVTTANMNDYLALDMVASVGGSWMATAKHIASRDWATITKLARDAMDHAIV